MTLTVSTPVVLADDAFRDQARNEWAEEGAIDIDQDAAVSEVEDEDGVTIGAWVAAWVWVDA